MATGTGDQPKHSSGSSASRALAKQGHATPPEPRRYGLLHVFVVIASMTAFGAVLGVLLAHLGH